MDKENLKKNMEKSNEAFNAALKKYDFEEMQSILVNMNFVIDGFDDETEKWEEAKDFVELYRKNNRIYKRTLDEKLRSETYEKILNNKYAASIIFFIKKNKKVNKDSIFSYLSNFDDNKAGWEEVLNILVNNDVADCLKVPTDNGMYFVYFLHPYFKEWFDQTVKA